MAHGVRGLLSPDPAAASRLSFHGRFRTSAFPENSRSIRAHRTASMPTIARATARKPRRMHGARCRHGSGNTKYWDDRHDRTVLPLQAARRLTARLPCEDARRPTYPKRSLLRRGLDICSISQSIQTKAAPRLTTTPRNSNVRPGAVSMVVIHETMQTAYQQTAIKERPRCRIHRCRWILRARRGPQL
jgi:hypothetical protein